MNIYSQTAWPFSLTATFGYIWWIIKHQLSSCCRMAEQHHQHMTKRSSNILAMTTHCMASFCPKIATSGWRRLKNLRPHGNVAKHQPAICTKPSSCSEYILHHVSSSQVDLMCYRVFSSFSKPTKTDVHRYNMKVSDSQNSWKLMAIEFWSCYSLRVLSSTVLQHISLVRRRHYQRELMTGGISIFKLGTSDPTMWFQIPKEMAWKKKTSSKLLRGSFKSRKNIWKTEGGHISMPMKLVTSWSSSVSPIFNPTQAQVTANRCNTGEKMRAISCLFHWWFFYGSLRKSGSIPTSLGWWFIIQWMSG